MEEYDLFNQNITVENFGKWLGLKGFSAEIRECFEGRIYLCVRKLCHLVDEEMDGEAIFDAFGCQVGPDCLKDVLPKNKSLSGD